MGGSSGGGKGIMDTGNPLGLIFGKDSTIGKIGANIDPAGRATEQGARNVLNVAQGKESFGSHQNWFGDGITGDIFNPMLGGNTTEQRSQWKDYEDTNREAWVTWSEKTGKANPYKREKDATTSLLFSGDEESLF